ncbi:flavin reductase family protein [Seleniivibrio woodruffii]|uniref:flavin reductase family protein n=1 Tax=Seleniivibrio woodruffii TaxID=1078050 RepID=UPI0026EC809E|nr:flavin reductase family protein [Seleniivibrio woodruffii]
MKEFPLSKAYRFIEPGPVILLSTFNGQKNNVMTLSYTMVIDDSTPLIAVSMGTWDFSFDILLSERECVVSIPSDNMLEKTVDIGNCTGADTDKFAKFGLTAVKAARVKAPLIKESPVNLECVIEDDSLLGRYNLIILRVVKAWCSQEHFRKIHHNGDGTFTVDSETFDMKSRMTRWPEYIS